ncbi:MAG: Na/Pi cotransporter family protein [Hyphomicrobiaceae bacterium]|nr:Na/Pi cotransporter family protein [Hyphomicrobiaceae bacterium]
MSATHALIQLLGAVSLLLWGLHMVRTGIVRGFGTQLRTLIGRGTANRGRAVVAGMGVTMVVQSSTATALIVSSFASGGLIETMPALAVMLGTDVGTTLVAQILSFDLSLLSPLLIIGGVAAHKMIGGMAWRQLGRAAIGLGLMLLALKIIVRTSEPMRDSPVLEAVFSALSGEPFIAVLLAALLTWLAHSSLAVVLLIMSLASTGIVSIPLALAMVLGANLGGVIPPIMATLNEGALARRVTLANAAFKTIGVLGCLPLIGFLPDLLQQIELSPARQVVNFHTAFNLAIVLVFMFLLPLAARTAERLLPARDDADMPGHPQFLDAATLDMPAVALNCAAREALRMGEYVEEMMRGVIVALQAPHKGKTSELKSMDDVIDSLYEEIKLYATKISRQEVDEPESRRIAEIQSFVTNLENIGDIIENIADMADRKDAEHLRFSDEGLAEITKLHAKVADNLNLAISVFMSADIGAARRLVKQKRVINTLERRITEKHMERLRQGRRESIETSALHMDILRDLRRIHSHITAVAYPILDAAGELKKSRLKKTA